MSMKNSNDTIGNRTRDISACSEVLHTTAPLRASQIKGKGLKFKVQRSVITQRKSEVMTLLFL
jgi:hypothetical protein